MDTKAIDKAIDLYNFYIEFNVNHILFHEKTIKCVEKVIDEIIENNYKTLDGIKYHEELNYWYEVISETKKLKSNNKQTL